LWDATRGKKDRDDQERKRKPKGETGVVDTKEAQKRLSRRTQLNKKKKPEKSVKHIKRIKNTKSEGLGAKKKSGEKKRKKKLGTNALKKGDLPHRSQAGLLDEQTSKLRTMTLSRTKRHSLCWGGVLSAGKNCSTVVTRGEEKTSTEEGDSKSQKSQEPRGVYFGGIKRIPGHHMRREGLNRERERSTDEDRQIPSRKGA